MKSAEVQAAIHKEELMKALREMTINDPDFNGGAWSIWEAEVLESAARLIRSWYRERDSEAARSVPV